MMSLCAVGAQCRQHGTGLLPVVLQVAGLSESPPAGGAGVGSLSGVHTLVSPQRSRVSEALPAV